MYIKREIEEGRVIVDMKERHFLIRRDFFRELMNVEDVYDACKCGNAMMRTKRKMAFWIMKAVCWMRGENFKHELSRMKVMHNLMQVHEYMKAKDKEIKLPAFFSVFENGDICYKGKLEEKDWHIQKNRKQ